MCHEARNHHLLVEWGMLIKKLYELRELDQRDHLIDPYARFQWRLLVKDLSRSQEWDQMARFIPKLRFLNSPSPDLRESEYKEFLTFAEKRVEELKIDQA